MTRVYKLRIYPNKRQEKLIQTTFQAVKYVYDYFLDRRTAEHKLNHNLTFCQCSRELTQLKQTEVWLQEPDKWALCNALRDLDQAFENFFHKRKRYPVHKDTKEQRVYRTTQSNKTIAINYHHLKLPKLGWIRFRDKQSPEGVILHAKIIQDPAGHYFAAICCKDVPMKTVPKTGKSVGIDMGLKEIVTFSDGSAVDNPYFYKKESKRISRARRILDKRKKKGYRYKKARLKFARLWDKVSNQRRDFLNKLTTKIIKDYDVICHETIYVMQTREKQFTEVRKAQEDASWYTFFRMLNYKAQWYGKQVIKVDQFFPSSQLCSNCGTRYPEMKNLNIKEFHCSECGLTLHRDVNAAINIEKEGLRILNQK